MKEIATNIFIETNYSLVNVGAILTAKGWVCIDTPPYPRDAQSWRTALQAINPRPFLYVINTGQHRDYIIGNHWFDVPVVTHEAAAYHLLGLQNNTFMSQAAEALSSSNDELFEIAAAKLVLPEISYSESIALHCGDRIVELFHHPGETLGTTWVVFPDEKVLFTGNSTIIDRHPYLTEPTSKLWLETLALVQEKYKGWTIIPGRGELHKAAETKILVEYLNLARKEVNDLIKADRARSDVTQLITGIQPFFPPDNPDSEELQRRIKSTLESIYEELQLEIAAQQNTEQEVA